MSDKSILDLPKELIDHIVTFLPTTEPRRDIAACRLVCRQLRDSSSPYLITRVVFAKRFREIEKLQWVVNHPYFSMTVTEFVYDGSTFEEGGARTFSTYVVMCERAVNRGLRDFEDQEWINMKRKHVETYKGLQKFVGSEEGEGTKLTVLEDQSESLSNGYGGFSIQELQEVDPYGLGLETDQAPAQGNKGYRFGCHKTWPIYRQFFRAQEALRQEGMCHGILVDAFTKLTALKSVVHSDFRRLMWPRESYDAGCRRLFDGALEPRDAFDEVGEMPIVPLLHAMARGKVEIKSLTAGRHFVHTPSGGWVSFQDEEHGREVKDPCPVLFREFFDMSDSDLEAAGTVFRQLSHLDLSMRISELQDSFGGGSHYETTRDQDLKFVCQLFVMSTAHLTHLTFALEDILPPPSEVDNPPGDDLFGRLLGVCTFQSLRSLQLVGWRFSLAELQTWLEKHAETMREIRLLFNSLIGSSLDLALWAGPNLPDLEGVEMHNYKDRVPLDWVDETADDEDNEEEERIDLTVVLADDETNEYLEFLWLDGRTNAFEATHIVERKSSVSIHKQ